MDFIRITHQRLCDTRVSVHKTSQKRVCMDGVATNTTKENRYSLAFNYFVKGEISNQKTSELTL